MYVCIKHASYTAFFFLKKSVTHKRSMGKESTKKKEPRKNLDQNSYLVGECIVLEKVVFLLLQRACLFLLPACLCEIVIYLRTIIKSFHNIVQAFIYTLLYELLSSLSSLLFFFPFLSTNQ